MKHKIVFLLTMLITLCAMSIISFADTISNIQLTDDGYVTWDYDGDESAISGFEIRLSRNENWIGVKHYTYSKKFDLNPLMNTEGLYYAQIKPMKNGTNNDEIRCSETIYVSKEQAEKNKEKFSPQNEKYSDGRPNYDRIINFGWFDEDGKYIYRTMDGTKIQNYYTYSNGDMYYLDENGYMVTDSLILINGDLKYFDTSGKLVKKE